MLYGRLEVTKFGGNTLQHGTYTLINFVEKQNVDIKERRFRNGVRKY